MKKFLKASLLLFSFGIAVNLTTTTTKAASLNWVHKNQTWHLLKNNQTMTGWQFVGGSWYYLKQNGDMITNWQKINNQWYYFNSSGQMLTGWQQLGGSWYYLKSNGAMVTGWQRINNKWYYLNSSGQMLTGWQRLGSSWYYLKSNGAMATGWQKINNKWYYLNGSGQMLTDWQRIGNPWYYLKSNGAMATNWQKINNKWYYLNGSGQMLKGWQWLGNSWYYLKSNGVMVTGWQKINNKWYYLNGSGQMLTGSITLKGITYTFNNNGALVASYQDKTPISNTSYLFDYHFSPYFGSVTGNYPLYQEDFYQLPAAFPSKNSSTLIGKTFKITREIKTTSKRFVLLQTSTGKFWIEKAGIARNDQAAKFVANIKGPGKNVTKNYDQFASVLLAQAILESGYGRSSLAAKYHNYFGIKAGKNYTGKNVVALPTKEWDKKTQQYITIKDRFMTYPTMEDSFKDRCLFIERGGNTGNPNFYHGAKKSVAKTYENATKFLTGRYATAWDYNIQLNHLIEYWDLADCD